MNRRLFLALLPAALAGGCGFELRRHDGVPFSRLHIEAPPGSAVAQRLGAMIALGGGTQMTAAADAEAIVRLGAERRDKTILSLSGGGRVTEYRLSLKIGYDVIGRDGGLLAEAETIELVRDFTFDDSLLLAKGAEEGLLYRDMDGDAALRILRRLQVIKPGGR